MIHYQDLYRPDFLVVIYFIEQSDDIVFVTKISCTCADVLAVFRDQRLQSVMSCVIVCAD